MERLQLQQYRGKDSAEALKAKYSTTLDPDEEGQTSAEGGDMPTSQQKKTNAAVETAKLMDFMKVIDEGEIIQAQAPQRQGEVGEAESSEDKLARLENIAVDMVRKQQELVNALMVAEEKHRGLHNELLTLKNSQGKTAKMQAIGDATTTLGVGDKEFVDKWIGNGALVDASVLPPTAAPTQKSEVDRLIPGERIARKKLKQHQKAQAKAMELKERRRSASNMRRRSLSTGGSIETRGSITAGKQEEEREEKGSVFETAKTAADEMPSKSDSGTAADDVDQGAQSSWFSGSLL